MKKVTFFVIFSLLNMLFFSCELEKLKSSFATDLYTPAFQINNLTEQKIEFAVVSITDQEYETTKADTIQACSFSTIESNTLSSTKTVSLKELSKTGNGYFHAKVKFISEGKTLLLDKLWRYNKFNAKDSDDFYAGGYNTFLLKVVKENGEYKIVSEFLKR